MAEMEDMPSSLADAFRQKVTEHGISELWPRLRAVARPCYSIQLVARKGLRKWLPLARTDAAKRPGASRFGGLPDLPPGWSWPEQKAGLFTFVAQINLAELPKLGGLLPEQGLLYFFLGVDESSDNINHKVLYWDGAPQSLWRPKRPAGSSFLNADRAFFRPAGLQFLPTVSVPPFYTDPSLDEYGDALDKLTEALHNPNGRKESSRLLGYASDFCGDPQAAAYVSSQGHADIIFELNQTPEEIDQEIDQALRENNQATVEWLRKKRTSLRWFHESRAAHEQEIAHWQLLLEVDSHAACGMCWWDAGVLQFLIDSHDLASRIFARTHACIQSF
jgi:uncharacterized protein YwqG